jgi:hypothetical protein
MSSGRVRQAQGRAPAPADPGDARTPSVPASSRGETETSSGSEGSRLNFTGKLTLLYPKALNCARLPVGPAQITAPTGLLYRSVVLRLS